MLSTISRDHSAEFIASWWMRNVIGRSAARVKINILKYYIIIGYKFIWTISPLPLSRLIHTNVEFGRSPSSPCSSIVGTHWARLLETLFAHEAINFREITTGPHISNRTTADRYARLIIFATVILWKHFMEDFRLIRLCWPYLSGDHAASRPNIGPYLENILRMHSSFTVRFIFGFLFTFCSFIYTSHLPYPFLLIRLH